MRGSTARLVTAWVTLFVVGTDLFVVSPLLRMWERTFGVSVTTAGYAVSAFAVAYVVGAPYLGGLADRLSRRRILLVALLCFAVANLLTSASPWFAPLIAARLLAGLSVAGTTPSVYALVGDHAPGQRRAVWLGVTTSGLLSALWAGAPLGDLAAARFGWRPVFAALAVAAVLLTAVNRLVWPADDVRGARVPGRPAQTWRRVRAVSTTTLWAAGVYGLYTFLVSGLHRRGWGTGSTAAALAVYGVLAVVGSLLGGWIADRRPPRSTVTAGMAVLTGALVLVGAAHSSRVLTVAALGVMALGAYPVFPAQQTELLRSFPPEEAGRVLAWNQSAMYVGIAAGSLFGGWVMAGPGFGTLPFVCAGVAFLGVAGSRVATGRAVRSRGSAP